jgi:hypothetical protein
MSAGQHKQFGILRGAILFNFRTGFIKQNGNFEKSLELKSRNISKPIAVLSEVLVYFESCAK